MSSAFKIPAGYALVPLEPTLDMGWAYLKAARASSPTIEHSFNHAGYRAALAAAPTPPVDAVPGEPVGEVAKIVMFGGDLKEVSWRNGKMPAVGTKLYAASVASRAGSEPVAADQAVMVPSVFGNPPSPVAAPEAKQRFLELLAAAHRAIDGILDGLRRDTAHMATAKLVQSLTAPAAAAEPSEPDWRTQFGDLSFNAAKKIILDMDAEAARGLAISLLIQQRITDKALAARASAGEAQS